MGALAQDDELGKSGANSVFLLEYFWSPSGNGILFGDEGGDERYRILGWVTQGTIASTFFHFADVLLPL